MKPIVFRESNKSLGAPEKWDPEEHGECATLHVWTDGDQCISCWRPSWRERLSILFRGHVWMYVFGGNATQPPVWVLGKRSPFCSTDTPLWRRLIERCSRLVAKVRRPCVS